MIIVVKRGGRFCGQHVGDPGLDADALAQILPTLGSRYDRSESVLQLLVLLG